MVFDLITLRSFLQRRFQIDPSEVQLSSTLEADLGLDELDRIELLMYLEQWYEIEFPDESLNRYESIVELAIYVTLHKMDQYPIPLFSWLLTKSDR